MGLINQLKCLGTDKLLAYAEKHSAGAKVSVNFKKMFNWKKNFFESSERPIQFCKKSQK